MEKTEEKEIKSGRGKGSPVPAEIKGQFNWGVFALPLFWSFANETKLPLLCLLLPFWFLPGINTIFSIYCGIHGNEWAWQNKTWGNIHEFKDAQKTWAKLGFVYMLCVTLVSGYIILSLGGGLKNIFNTKNAEWDSEYCQNDVQNFPSALLAFGTSGGNSVGSLHEEAQLVDMLVSVRGMKKVSSQSAISKQGVVYEFVAKGSEPCDIIKKNCGVKIKREATTMCPDNVSLCLEERTFCKMFIGQTEVKQLEATTKVKPLGRKK